jgi:hypothetical protein
MNIEQLKCELERLGVPRRVYSLNGGKDERLCIECRDGEWVVFFVERGQERTLKQFVSESDACAFMLTELKLEM